MYNDIKAGIYETLLRGCSKEDEDSIIKDLLETNIRQRGDIGGLRRKLDGELWNWKGCMKFNLAETEAINM